MTRDELGRRLSHLSDQDDLRATAEDLIGDAERLRQIEAEKLSLTEGDPRLADLAEEAARLVRRMAPKAMAQKEMASETEG